MSGLIDGVHGNRMKIMEKRLKASAAWSQKGPPPHQLPTVAFRQPVIKVGGNSKQSVEKEREKEG